MKERFTKFIDTIIALDKGDHTLTDQQWMKKQKWIFALKLFWVIVLVATFLLTINVSVSYFVYFFYFVSVLYILFLLLTVVCFSKSSTRFEEWFQQTKLYQLYVADYRETKSIARIRKKKIIVYIYILMAISIYLAPILAVKIGLGALTVFITYYLFWVIPDKK